MNRFTHRVVMSIFVIYLLAPAGTRAGSGTLWEVPEWLRSYPGVAFQINSPIENSPDSDATFAFGTDDPPERVAEFYRQKISAAGMKPEIVTSRSYELSEIKIDSSNQNSRISVSIQAAPWLAASLPDRGKRTKVSVVYGKNLLISSQGIRWDEYWPLLIMLPVGILYLIFWSWIIIDCTTKESEEGNTKLVWIGIILVAQLIGALLYFFIRRPQRKAELGR